MSEPSEAKKHAASQSKLRKEREKGTVASSQESSGFFATGLGILGLAATAGFIWVYLRALIDSAMLSVGLPYAEARRAGLDAIGETVLVVIAPLLLITLVTAFVAAILFNKGFVFAIKPVLPQMERISPMSGLKRIYGRRGLVETPVSAVRVLIWLAYVGLLGLLPIWTLMRGASCVGVCFVHFVLPIIWLLVIGAVVIHLLSAGMDMIVQRGLFMNEQRMTETERKTERKEQHGTPEIRQERRRRMLEDAQPSRKAILERATICFFTKDRAVGIEFRPPKVKLPYVVARGDTPDEVARIRKIIAMKGWPEKEQAALVQAGFSTQLGNVLPEQTFPDFVDAVEELFGD